MPNRLAPEKSPYLLQHADNPVDWYPWGDEAFAAARAANKPIFLSVGYSTCHWCHVMAHESFESQAIADVLNRDFISITSSRASSMGIPRRRPGSTPMVDRLVMRCYRYFHAIRVNAVTAGVRWSAPWLSLRPQPQHVRCMP